VGLQLVDPDNRRPVDFELPASCRGRIELSAAATARCWELLANLSDGRIKAYLLYQTLGLRRAQEAVFTRATCRWTPLGPADHVVPARWLDDAGLSWSFRGWWCSRRRIGAVTGPEVWRQTRLLLPPPRRAVALRTCSPARCSPHGYRGTRGRCWVGSGRFPVALLRRLETTAEG
jgi:maltooligosyltrehalose synthase